MSPKRLFLMVLASCFVCVGAGDALADATITGSVKLDLPGGKKPRRKKLQMAADPVCNAKHDAPVVSESPAIVDEDGEPCWQVHHIVMADDGTFYACENDHPRRSGYLWEIRL